MTQIGGNHHNTYKVEAIGVGKSSPFGNSHISFPPDYYIDGNHHKMYKVEAIGVGKSSPFGKSHKPSCLPSSQIDGNRHNTYIWEDAWIFFSSTSLNGHPEK
jgi:hypothetical protein